MNELKWTNWSHSFSSYPEQILSPNSEKEIIGIVQDAKKTNSKIKIFGSGHSCSQIAETKSGILISLEKYNSILFASRYFNSTFKCYYIKIFFI